MKDKTKTQNPTKTADDLTKVTDNTKRVMMKTDDPLEGDLTTTEEEDTEEMEKEKTQSKHQCWKELLNQREIPNDLKDTEVAEEVAAADVDTADVVDDGNSTDEAVTLDPVYELDPTNETEVDPETGELLERK
jgi:hypothetical protein